MNDNGIAVIVFGVVMLSILITVVLFTLRLHKNQSSSKNISLRNTKKYKKQKVTAAVIGAIISLIVSLIAAYIGHRFGWNK